MKTYKTLTTLLVLSTFTSCTKFVSEHKIQIDHRITIEVEPQTTNLLRELAENTQTKTTKHEKNIQDKQR